jgi:RNA polymerase sigma factor (sigma-70 family)
VATPSDPKPMAALREGSDRDRRFSGLMRAAQAADADSYACLLEELTPILRRAVRRQRRFLKPHDAEDLLQDILLSVHEARRTYDPTRPFLPWAMAIARNRMADGARRYMRRAAHEVVVERLPETFSADDPNVTGGVYGDPDALRLAVEALPQGQRNAVEMLKLREMSLKEASTLSGMSVAALKVAVHRGMNTLRKILTAKA